MILLAVQAALLGWVGWVSCPNKTEVGHIGAAAYYVNSLRFDVFHVNPPLTRMIIGLPIILCDPKYDWSCYSSRPQDRTEWALGKAFIAANGFEKMRWCFALARWSLVPVILLGGYFGCRLSGELYGGVARIVFLILWCCSPLLLAWGATICPDAAAGALGLVAFYAYHVWLRNPSWLQAGIAGGCLGLLPLTKLTWIIAFGVWPLIWCFWTMPIYWTRSEEYRLRTGPIWQLMVICFLGLVTVNMGYLFDGTCRPLGRYVFVSRLFQGQDTATNQQEAVAANRFAETWLGRIPVPLPAEFVQGMDTQRYDFEQGIPSYLRGQWADHGWWYYYLYALMLKEPLGTWILVVIAVGITLCDVRKKWRHRHSAPCVSRDVSLESQECCWRTSWRDEMALLVPAAAILIFISSQTGFSVHSRYILPALPFLFVWTSKVGRTFGTVVSFRSIAPGTKKRGRPFLATVVVLVLIWSAVSSFIVYPHSLSYFNELAAIIPTPFDISYPDSGNRDVHGHGVLAMVRQVSDAGPLNGPRHLLDSNIDWGQDLFYLKAWLDAHPEVRLDGLAYFGFFPANLAKIPRTRLPPGYLQDKRPGLHITGTRYGPMPGWYALSVNHIYARESRYRYFLHFEPVAMAGYSIYIYHITLEDANRVRRRLGLPEVKEPPDVRDSDRTGHGDKECGGPSLKETYS